jgi:O-antigen/teichoic acid export membrane protein
MGFFKQSSLYLAGRIVPALIGVGGVAIYTRLLDPSVMGAYALLLSTSVLASVIGFTWLRIAALRVAAGHDEEPQADFAATIAWLFVATAVAVGIIEAIAVHVYQPEYPIVLVLLAVAAAIASAWYDLNASLLQARLDVAGWGLLNLVRAVVIVAASVVCILLGLKAEGLLIGFILGNAATLAFIRLWKDAPRGRFDRELFWRCFHFGWPQSINAAQAIVAPVIQRWTIQFAAGTAAVGIFAVAQDFSSQTIASLVGSVSLAGIPLAFRAKERGDGQALAEQLRANAQLIFGIALPATAGFAMLAEQITHTFFGARFWDGTPLLLVLIGISAFALNLRVYYFDQAFELAMETRPQAMISLAGSILAVGGTFVLIPRIGVAGAGVSALAGSILALVMSMVWGARIQRMPIPLDDWLRTAFATGAMVFALAFVPKDVHTAGLVAALIGGGLIYLAFSSITRIALIRTHFGGRFA